MTRRLTAWNSTISKRVREVPLTIDPQTDMSNDFKALVGKLAVPHHAGPTFRALLNAGFDALPAIRHGLRHESPEVRRRCCSFLDHFVT
jgi:hypothetical protein